MKKFVLPIIISFLLIVLVTDMFCTFTNMVKVIKIDNQTIIKLQQDIEELQIENRNLKYDIFLEENSNILSRGMPILEFVPEFIQVLESNLEIIPIPELTPELTPEPTPEPTPKPTPIPKPIPTITPTPIISNNNVSELARIIFFETKGLSYDEQLAVGQIVINRSKSSGLSIYQTIHQKETSGDAVFSPTIFSNYYNLDYDNSSEKAATWLLGGNIYQPVGNALYFCTLKSYNSGNWHFQYVKSGVGRIILQLEGHLYIR